MSAAPAIRGRSVRRRFLGDRRGVSAVEFALVGPVFLLLLTGLFDFGILLFLTMTLESAALNAARYGATGQIPEGVTREERIRQIVHEHTMGVLNDNDLEVDTRVYASFAELAAAEWLGDLNGNGAHDDGEPFDDVNGNGLWDGDPGVPGAGGAEDIVLYRVSAEYRFVTPLLWELGPLVLRAAAPITNEPF